MTEDSGKSENLPLAQSAQHLLEECRMVLPGIQALFGFQLIAVFNESFAKKLSDAEQGLHLLAIALIAVAVALVMAPAAYHRQTDPERVTEHFIRLSSKLLLSSMFPLALGVGLDFYLVAHVITGQTAASAAFSVGLLGVYAALWLALPRLGRKP